jgi:hypothetical protein
MARVRVTRRTWVRRNPSRGKPQRIEFGAHGDLLGGVVVRVAAGRHVQLTALGDGPWPAGIERHPGLDVGARRVVELGVDEPTA